MNKICGNCQEVKSLSDFPMLRGKIPYSYCKSCKSKQDAASYKKHRDRKLHAAANYRNLNKHAVLAKILEWHKENPERVRSIKAAWRKRNPEAKRASEATRRARKRNAGGRHSAADIKALLALQNGKCAICHVILGQYHVDHVMPLALGGDNSKENIQILCPTCNDKKGAMHPREFLAKIGVSL